jgi:hypothetical protein
MVAPGWLMLLLCSNGCILALCAGLEEAEAAHVRDLFAREDLGTFTGSWTAAVYVHDALAVRITPVTSRAQHRWASSS